MDYEQLYDNDSNSKSPPGSTRQTFDQFTDRMQWSPEAYTTGDSPDPTQSSFQTSTGEFRSLRDGSDWVGAVEVGKVLAGKKNEPLSLNEQMRKFSNRYLYETVQCSRYDLAKEYFTKEKPISEMLKTPQALTRTQKKRSPPPPNKHILVQHPLTIRRKDHFSRIDGLKQEHASRITCTIDGSPWKPKSFVDRSECGWYRKHRLNTQPSPAKRMKQPNLLKPSNLIRLTKVRRDTNSFFKPVL